MYEALLKATPEYQKVAASFGSAGPAALFGLPPAGRALLYAALQKDLDRVLCIVTPGEAEATHFADDLKALGLTAAMFPPRDFMLRPVEGAGREYEYRRLSVLGSLAGGRLKAVCVPAEALLQYTVPRAEFIQNTLTLKPGMVYNREALVARLFAAGYVRRSQVDGPGQFSVRGDIVDIYAPDMRQPARVEYWDDEIDSISSFDLLTQRRDSALEKIYLSPAREVLFGDTAETAEALRAAIKKARGRHRTALEKATEADLAQLDSGLMPEAMDKYYGLRYPSPATLLDHLDTPLFILDEVGGIRDAQKATEFRRSEELTGLLEEGVLCPGLDVLYQTMDDLAAAAQKQSTLLCENFLRGMNEFKLKDLINAEAFAAPNWNGDLVSLREDLDPLIAQGYAVTLFSGTPKGAAALTRDLADKGYSVSMSRDVRPTKGIVQVLPGHLTAGCTFPFAHAAVLSSRRHGLEEETSAETKKRKKNKNALSSLSDIKPGDYVVHQSHGIGMYAGIQRLEVQGATKDYLKVQYSGSDVLYVPVTQLDLLSRYTAPGDEEKVKLAKLGGAEWQRTRAKVKKATEEMAQELIELYARRRQATGYAFPPDGDWQRDFETRFDYDETDDQLHATAEIKQDMEKGWPMDRLLCGDVGVGKTEVALRAAFKCVMGGKQCAILAPTTILAWQHFNTALTGLQIRNGALTGIDTTAGSVACEQLILAVGHSARDTFAMLHVVLPVTYVFVTVGIFKSSFTVPDIIFPLPVIFGTVIPGQCSFAVFLVILPRAYILGTVLPGIRSLAFAFIIHPVALINITIVIVHGSFTVLVILKPHAVITVVIHKIVDTPAMLLVLKPLPLILFTVGKSVNSIPFTLSFNVLAFIDIAVLKNRLSFAVGFASFHLTGIYGTVLKRMRPYFYFRRESSLYFIEEAAFFLGCDTAL